MKPGGNWSCLWQLPLTGRLLILLNILIQDGWEFVLLSERSDIDNVVQPTPKSVGELKKAERDGPVQMNTYLKFLQDLARRTKADDAVAMQILPSLKRHKLLNIVDYVDPELGSTP
jgi:hypothetical protein